MSFHTRSLLVGVVLLAAVAGSLAFAPLAQAAGETTVRLSPVNQSVEANDTTTVDIVVENASEGVRSYDVSVLLERDGVASVADVELKGDPGFSDVTPGDDRQRVRITAGTADTATGSNVTIATVTFTANGTGTAPVALSVNALGDSDNVAYSVSRTVNGSLTVGDADAGEDTTAPVADAGDDLTTPVNTTVTLNASGSTDNVGIDTYQWDLDGDGTVERTTETPTVTTSFARPGTTAVELSVIDAAGNTDSDTVNVTAVSDSEGVTVRLDPESSRVSRGNETAVDVVVENVTNGVRSYDISVSTAAGSPVTFENATLAGDPGFRSVDISPNGDRISITAAAADTPDTGAVTVATVTVRGTHSGTATLEATVTALGDEDNEPYTVGTVSNTSVTVGQRTGPPAIVADRLPTDVDNDGVYEDINGDGNVSVSDVQAMFANRDDDALRQQRGAFDFTGDGDINIVDVQRLFADVRGRPA
ncbi:PKD domain-containing protein [Haloferax prahovense]|uniref:PKD domain-containing protein n=1 Tax=Haloferax TaxID=2251 RepID=UPI000737BC2A|nr:PKD domain-containing protein [Haloferax sp. Q22]